VISVRSALISLYLVAIYFLIIFLKKQKNIKKIVVLISISLLFIYTMYKFSDPFKTKINYTKWTLEQINNPTAFSTTSDGGRIFSFRAALQVFKKNPLIGVGTGDVILAMQKEYQQLGVSELNIIPHNQFFAYFGFFGIDWFLLFYYFIIFLD
jgi:O-antigen ligase